MRAVRAPVPGEVAAVRVRPREQVSKGSILVALRVLEMEQNVASPVDGCVKLVWVVPGSLVRAGDILVEIA